MSKVDVYSYDICRDMLTQLQVKWQQIVGVKFQELGFFYILNLGGHFCDANWWITMKMFKKTEFVNHICMGNSF